MAAVRTTTLLCPLALLATLACGDPVAPDVSREEPVARPTPTGPVTSLVTSRGGSLSVTTDEGAVVTLTVPPNALGGDIDVTLTPLPAPSGLWFSVQLEPSWLRLYTPFQVDVVLPSTAEIADAGLILGTGADRIYLPTTVDQVARRVSSRSLSFFALGQTTGGAALAPAPSSHSPGGQLTAGPTSCATLQAAAQSTFDDLMASGRSEAAIRALLNVGALMQKQGCDSSSLLEQAENVACEEVAGVVQQARGTPTVAYGDFERQTRDILVWAGLLTLLGSDCNGQSDWQSAIDGEIADFLQFYSPRLQNLTGYAWETFQDLRQEALTVLDLYATAIQLSIPAAVADNLLNDAFNPTVRQMRDVAFALCRDQDWHYPLSRVTSTGLFSGRDIIGQTPPRPGTLLPPSSYSDFTDSDIFRDLQYCGTRIDLAGVVTSGGALPTVTAGTEGSVGNHTGEVSLSVPTRGHLRLSGDLLGFTCWNDVDADTEVELAVNGSVVRTLPRDGDGYLGVEPLDIDIQALADAAGITPRQGTSHELVLSRLRSGCSERLWGEDRYDLVTATLEWVNPTLEATVVLADTLMPGEEHEATVVVSVVDQMGESSHSAGIDVELSVAGATASSLSGSTDASGTFRTVLIPDGSGGNAVTLVANAVSFEGATATATRTAAVGAGGARMVSSRYGARGQVYIGTTVNESGEVVEGGYGYDGAFSAAVSVEGSGNITLSGSLGTTVSVDGAGRITSIIGQADSDMQKVSTDSMGAHVMGSGQGNAIVTFEVTGAPLDVRLSATVFARPHNNSVSIGSESGRARVRIMELDPDSHSSVVGVVFEMDSRTAPSPADTTITLPPGVYEFLGVAGTSTGTGCRGCQVDSESSVAFQLMFGGS